MISDKNTIISEIKNHVEDDSDVDLCLLFGSAVDERLKKTSDIDIAVGSVNSVSNEKRAELSVTLSNIFGRNVSVLDISTMNGIVLKEVLVKGITIKNADSFFLAGHITRMLDFVEDLYPTQKKGLIKKAERFANGK